MEQKQIRVIVADDDDFTRMGLLATLENDPQTQVVAWASDGYEIVEKALATKFDVALLDVDMPRQSGIQAAHELRRRFAECKIVMVTNFLHDSWLKDALAAGALGFVEKNARASQLIEAILCAHEGKRFINGRALDILTRPVNGGPSPVMDTQFAQAVEALPEKLRPVFDLLIRGQSNQQISRQTGLREASVRQYCTQIFRHLNLNSRATLIVKAADAGLI